MSSTVGDALRRVPDALDELVALVESARAMPLSSSCVLPREEALAIPDLIKTQDALPPDTEQMRIVDIVGLDTQADGGTHVFSTRQIGRVQITKVDNKGRQNRRVRIRLAEG